MVTNSLATGYKFEKRKLTAHCVYIKLLFKDCQRNVHKRCQANVPNDCGVDAKKMADLITKEIDKTPDKLQRVSKTSILVWYLCLL